MSAPLKFARRKIGRLFVICKCGCDRHGNVLWKCLCDCESIAIVRSADLQREKSTQCRSCARTTHGMARTATYCSWENMIQRCTNPFAPNWIDYGGRGITICERWFIFENFFSDMGERPDGTTLHRVDNGLVYGPSPLCIWATHKEQCAPGQRRLPGQEFITLTN